MIYTITFNPAIDYIMYLDGYHSGEVNRSRAEKALAGGKGINVSTVLKNLGVDNTAMGFIAGFTGRQIETMLAEAGIRTELVELEKGMTRINVKLKALEETEINGCGPDIPPEAVEELLKKLASLKEGDYLVMAGSIPQSLPSSMYRDIMQSLDGRGINTVVDATGKLLENTLPYRPFLIKPNHHELGEIFGRTLSDTEDIVECARKMQERGARNVLVSRAGEGAVLVSEDGGVYQSLPPEGRVVNSTGAGDSMVAGFLAGYTESGDYETAFLMGLCAGSASAFSEGLASGADIRALYEKMRCR